MPTRLLIATRNQGKLREIAPLLAPLGAELLSLADFPKVPEVEETGSTFEENAALKARAAARATGLITLADDSGLVVDALDGRPGVESRRMAATDPERNALLLELLRDVPPPRTARFVAAVAIAWPDGNLEVVEGVLEGEIACAPRGSHGFGFDPIFIPACSDRALAEMTPEQKNAISHRGQAFRRAARVLAARLG